MDESAKQQGEQVEDNGDMIQLFGWWWWFFQSPNTFRIAIHIAVVAITGGVDQ